MYITLHKEPLRIGLISMLKGIPREQLLEMSEKFYHDFLEERTNTEVTSVIKEKRAQINDPYITRGSQIYENFDIVMADKAIYAPYDKHQDQIVTFIICEKLSFDITKFDFMDIYENMHPSFRINMILSLEDGVLAYKHSDGTIHPYPVCKNEIAIPYFCKATTEDKWSHIKLFANNFFTATKCCTILNSDIVYYMQFNADQMKQIPLTSKQEGAQND